MSLVSYSDYVQTGNPWIPTLPRHWSLSGLGNIGQFLKGRGGSKQDASESGVPCIRYGELYTKYAYVIREAAGFVPEEIASEYVPVQRGDILFAASGEDMADIGRSAALLSDQRTVCGGDLVVLRPTREVVPEFLGYASDCSVVKAQKASVGRGTTVKHIYPDELKRVVLALPPLPEQLGISRFLERETAKIDALIYAQERLIALLQEKRQAVILQAVTKGLDSNVPMKDSAVEWLPAIPAHWVTRPLKALVSSIEQGWSPQCESYPAQMPDEWGILKAGCVNGGEFTASENKRLPDDLMPDPSLCVLKGDLLISRANTPELVGSAAVVEEDHSRLLICDKLYRLRFRRDETTPNFVAHYLSSTLVRSRFAQRATGASASMVNISQSEILDLPMPTPPLGEQLAINDHISTQATAISHAVELAEMSSSLLAERRTALITAAVTGQIDVRGLVETAA